MHWLLQTEQDAAKDQVLFVHRKPQLHCRVLFRQHLVLC